MTLLYAFVFLVSLPFAIPYAIGYALFFAVRERITEWRFRNVRYEVTEQGKLLTVRKATEADLREPKIYRMAERSPS